MDAQDCRAAYQRWLLQYYIDHAPALPTFEAAVLDAYVAGWHDRMTPGIAESAEEEMRAILNEIQQRA